jgi:hypothetical protein
MTQSSSLEAAPANLLLSNVEYQVTETSRGIWRRFVYSNGQLFEEFISHRSLFGLPLVHFTRRICPETGKRIVAKGVIAVGRMAVGILAIGQAAAGILAIGQLAIGIAFGLEQASTGILAIGQLAIASTFAIGQFAVGSVAIGQLALGKYVLAQLGIGDFVWDVRGQSPQAVQFFQSLIP